MAPGNHEFGLAVGIHVHRNNSVELGQSRRVIGLWNGYRVIGAEELAIASPGVQPGGGAVGGIGRSQGQNLNAPVCVQVNQRG